MIQICSLQDPLLYIDKQCLFCGLWNAFSDNFLCERNFCVTVGLGVRHTWWGSHEFHGIPPRLCLFPDFGSFSEKCLHIISVFLDRELLFSNQWSIRPTLFPVSSYLQVMPIWASFTYFLVLCRLFQRSVGLMTEFV